jgi:hypothetical protein
VQHDFFAHETQASSSLVTSHEGAFSGRMVGMTYDVRPVSTHVVPVIASGA